MKVLEQNPSVKENYSRYWKFELSGFELSGIRVTEVNYLPIYNQGINLCELLKLSNGITYHKN